MNPTPAEQSAIRFLMDALADRGWPDTCGLALRVVREFRANPSVFRTPRRLMALVPSAFVVSNKTTKSAVASFLSGLGPSLAVQLSEAGPPGAPLQVLYLTANPDAIEVEEIKPDGTYVRTGTYLRVDREVKAVKEALRRSNLRDQVRIEHQPAATIRDLTSGLNDFRPQIVHFSGHASSSGLEFEDHHAAGSQEITFPLLAEVCAATDTPPKLIVLNACESLEGADDLIGVVPAVIGMSALIDDGAAVEFAAAFYGAVASGQSLGAALAQGRLAIRTAGLPGADLPELRTRRGVDPARLHLI